MSEKVLAVPELVGAVLQHLDLTSLVSAAQVNHTWTEEATNFIWRGALHETLYEEAFPSALRRLAGSPQERRDWYTRKIRHLCLGASDTERPPITLFLKQKGFRFPNVRSLLLDVTSENSHEDVVAQFLQPNLISMELFGGYYTSWFFEQIQARSPSLRSFLMDNRLFDDGYNPQSLNASSFLGFLLAMPCIQFLETLYGLEPLLDIRVMRHIFTRPGLQGLLFGSNTIWDMKLMNEIDLDAEIFPDLRCLEVTADEKPLTMILPRLQLLQSVYLSLPRLFSHIMSLDTLFESLSKCPNLKEISISYDHGPAFIDAIVSGSALLSIAKNCRLLRVLEVTSSLKGSVDDELIEDITSRLSYLEIFSFGDAQFDGLSYSSIVSFARHCPYLCELHLPVSVELTQLESESSDLKFHQLQNLHVSQVTFLPMETAEDSSMTLGILIRMLDRRFPKLFTLWVIHGSGEHADRAKKSVCKYLEKRINHEYIPRRRVAREVALGILES